MILLIGLAVGVDYALFYLRRVREERAAGRSKEAAIEAAAATSGRAVLVSGITVMIAMAGMYFAGAADVHLIRHRHHRGGRSRDARIAHGASRPAVDARRSHREGPDSRPGPSPQPGGPRGHLVADRGPGAAAPAAVGRAWPPACSWRWRSRRSGWTSAPRTPRPRCRRTSRWCRRSTTSRRRSRRETSSLSVVDQGQGRDRPGREGRAGEARARRGAAPGAAPVERRCDRREPRQDGRDRRGRDRRQRDRRRVEPGARGAPDRRGATRRSDRSTASRPTSAAARRRMPTSRTR